MTSIRAGAVLVGLALALTACGGARPTYNLEATLLCLSQRPEYEPGAGPYPPLRGRAFAFTLREDESRLPSLPGIYQIARVQIHEADATADNLADDPTYAVSVSFLDTETHAKDYYETSAALARRTVDDPAELVRRAGTNVVLVDTVPSAILPDRYWELITNCLKT